MFQARTLPPRVDVGFTILPAGNATKIALRSPPTLRGSELERCLQSAISRVSFPPTTGRFWPIRAILGKTQLAKGL